MRNHSRSLSEVEETAASHVTSPMTKAAAHRRLTAELSRLSAKQLGRLQAAADEVLQQLESLAAMQTTPVGQMLKGVSNFTEDAHYPDGDIHDERTGSQYYYHAHRGSETENGHFHVFVRAKAVPDSMHPAFPDFAKNRPIADEAIAHLVAISIGHDSLPTKMFTTNQWVTGETFYSARDTTRLLDCFDATANEACAETSRWISALLLLFRPQIGWLLSERDQSIATWARQHPSRDVLEDEELEITSEVTIDIDAQIACIDAEASRRKKRKASRKPKRKT